MPFSLKVWTFKSANLSLMQKPQSVQRGRIAHFNPKLITLPVNQSRVIFTEISVQATCQTAEVPLGWGVGRVHSSDLNLQETIKEMC